MSTDKKKHSDVFDEIYERYEQEHDFKNLPGYGRPISKKALQGSVLNSVLKESGYKPPWLELQHRIRAEFTELLRIVEEEGEGNQEVEEKLRILNEQVIKYNQICPVQMQKSAITLMEMKYQYKVWE
ncbi:DUF1992 domain-containing protein [Mechercharimyces sp. CAU 1602]|uniref:DUF1992 domain-containing protein n=1 Tax=Mechercharimyces sp. CAU 1602 TaxID=2973933 RepID=UPI00216194B4|nr:DUF1992 domain-containing protein [Mechercharimyces sp. CAU 1602]MCS1352716.1 DUF1992 domain-containing protein [Mechercharimyces sp. CAU 1602]